MWYLTLKFYFKIFDLFLFLELAVIKHVDLSYKVDFENKILYGTAVLNIQVKDYIEDVVSGKLISLCNYVCMS